jgi:hypothetical protein
LQRQRRHEPQQIRCARFDSRLVGGDGAHVEPGQRRSRGQGQQSAQHRQHDRLVEDEVGVSAVPASDGMRHQRDRADAQHLHQRVDQESGIARRSHARDGGFAEAGNKIQVDQLADHDGDHAGDDRWRHAQDVAHNGAARQVFHCQIPFPARGCPARQPRATIHSAAEMRLNSVACSSNSPR